MLIIKKLLTAIVSMVFIVVLSGCGAKGYNVKSTISESQIMHDNEKAYVLFSRPYGGTPSGGGAILFPIVEYFPKKKDVSMVTIIGVLEKYLYPIDPGVHYFYEPQYRKFIKIDAEKGKVYVAQARVKMFTTPTLKLVRDIEWAGQLNSYPLIENTPEALMWLGRKKLRIIKKATDDYPDWSEAKLKEAEYFLLKEDGFGIEELKQATESAKAKKR